jgi:hypothetical protein
VGATSIRIVDLATALEMNVPFARRYLIFDCCFAGSVVSEFMSSPGSVALSKTKEAFPTVGTAILCSSSSQDISIAPTGGRFTRFSETLLGVLVEGNGRISTDLSLYNVGAQARERIVERYPEDRMRPEVHPPNQREGNVAMVELFPNAALRSGRRRELTKCGAANYVVAPRPLQNPRCKHQKTDRLDARALLENLESYLRGNRDAMSIVAVPSPEQDSSISETPSTLMNGAFFTA